MHAGPDNAPVPCPRLPRCAEIQREAARHIPIAQDDGDCPFRNDPVLACHVTQGGPAGLGREVGHDHVLRRDDCGTAGPAGGTGFQPVESLQYRHGQRAVPARAQDTARAQHDHRHAVRRDQFDTAAHEVQHFAQRKLVRQRLHHVALQFAQLPVMGNVVQDDNNIRKLPIGPVMRGYRTAQPQVLALFSTGMDILFKPRAPRQIPPELPQGGDIAFPARKQRAERGIVQGGGLHPQQVGQGAVGVSDAVLWIKDQNAPVRRLHDQGADFSVLACLFFFRTVKQGHQFVQAAIPAYAFTVQAYGHAQTVLAAQGGATVLCRGHGQRGRGIDSPVGKEAAQARFCQIRGVIAGQGTGARVTVHNATRYIRHHHGHGQLFQQGGGNPCDVRHDRVFHNIKGHHAPDRKGLSGACSAVGQRQ